MITITMEGLLRSFFDNDPGITREEVAEKIIGMMNRSFAQGDEIYSTDLFTPLHTPLEVSQHLLHRGSIFVEPNMG